MRRARDDCPWWRCAAFALAATSGTACPASYARLDTADACKSAAAAASQAFGGSAIYSYYPYGCYWHTITGSVYYNSNNASGAANFYAQPLCAGAALQARTPRRTLRSRLARCDTGRRAGAAATAPTFSPAAGMPYRRPRSLRSSRAWCGRSVGSM
jgi:hypothetical protein